MMTDLTAPATKQDLFEHQNATKKDIEGFAALLTKQIDDLYKANERWKNELSRKFDRTEKHMKLYFDVAVENFKKDLKTIDVEKIDGYGERIDHLEVLAGVRR